MHEQSRLGHAIGNLLLMMIIIGALPFVAGDETESPVCTCIEMLLYLGWKLSG